MNKIKKCITHFLIQCQSKTKSYAQQTHHHYATFFHPKWQQFYTYSSFNLSNLAFLLPS